MGAALNKCRPQIEYLDDSDTESEEGEMLKADEDALRAIRAADMALKKWWPEGESPRSWRGVYWSDDRVYRLDFERRGLEVLAPQIGQLTALTKLILWDCPLKELPPQIGQLTALTDLYLSNCEQLKELPPQIGQLTALTELTLYGCKLKELPPQIGQLTALTSLSLGNCWQLKELPPQFGQLLALAYLDFGGCGQLTFAPGAEEGQPVQTIVAAYAPLLIVAPRKDTPGELHAFLRANPLAVPVFYKTILTDAAYATWLGEAVKATPELAKLTDALGRRAIDAAHSACKREMQAALFLLGRFDVDDGPLLHRSATAAVAAADDHGDPEAKPVPRVALKAMRGAEQVRAELEGRLGLESKHVVAVKAVFADEEALARGEGADAWQRIKHAAAELKIDAVVKPDLSNSILAHFFTQKEVERPSAAAGPPATLSRQLTPGTLGASSEYAFILVLELADRSLATALMHDRIAANEWPLVRKMGADLARGLDSLHANGRIHADFKPLNICRVPVVDDNFTTFFAWELIDFDVSCPFGEGFGSKLPSSGYCPPEMAKVLLKAIKPSTGKLVNMEELSQYKADVAYDLWSFGVVLFHLGTGKSLWHTNQDDSISQADLRKLANWNERTCKTALGRFSKGETKTKDEEALQDLVYKLLEPDREQRMKLFSSKSGESEMQMVLKHPFLAAKSLDDANLQNLSDKLDVVIEMGLEHRIELQHAFQVLLRGIFEATEVKTPTTFIILDEILSAEEPELSVEEQDQLLSLKEDGSGIEFTGDAKAAKDRFDKGMTWLKRLQTFGEGIVEKNPNKVFGKIKEVFGELMTKETMYFYLVDELTGLPVRGDGYPIKITKPAELVPKLLPVMQVGMRAMSLYNGVAGVAQMVGYPAPKVPEAWRKGAQSSVEMLKQESSVEKFGAVHAKVQEGQEESESTHGAALRELKRFLEENDQDERYAGLRRIADEDGNAVWTILQESDVITKLEERTKERKQEEQRLREDLFSRAQYTQIRTPSEMPLAAAEARTVDDAAERTATEEAAASPAMSASTMKREGGGGSNGGKGSESNNSTSRPALMTVDHGCAVICSLQ